ncbi:hypothetical protein KP509_38G018900 [Ceratopteris richardii]|uniref:Uncharacterized protein n=1 Tax=Ceratopteris richardii TaxID=49495 RepID=A0A8T2Q2V5_CERRI|nr:hypothetical protein KP509_38G018900 [Ceratopteris richardii]
MALEMYHGKQIAGQRFLFYAYKLASAPKFDIRKFLCSSGAAREMPKFMPHLRMISCSHSCRNLNSNSTYNFGAHRLSSLKKVGSDQCREKKVAFCRASISRGARLVHSSTEQSLTQSNEEWRSRVIPSNSIEKQPAMTVAVDIDEVLGSFLLALNAFIAENYFCEHNISDFHVYDFTKVWRCSRVEADLRVHSFFKSKHFDEGIFPIPGAYKALLQLSSFCNLCVVTSRQNIIKEATVSWIERHYSGIFNGVHFGNHFALEGMARTKSEICRDVGATVLIDDNPVYALDCAQNGMEVLLFDLNNSYPWSKMEGLQHPSIKRVHSWDEVEMILRSKLSAVEA